MTEIARLILEQTGSKSRIEHRPLPVDDPKRRQPVIAQARNVLGWAPRVPLDAGLRATIDYFSLKVFTPEAPRATGERRPAQRGRLAPARVRQAPAQVSVGSEVRLAGSELRRPGA
jgi:hypothetical protein